MSICTIPPTGWHCTRGEGHGGPCAAVPAPYCERCNGRGVIETGTMSKGPGGLGFDTVPCGCEERQAYRDAAEEAGWLIEMETFDSDEGPLPTAWAPEGSYTFGPPITREQVPAGAVYEHGRAPGKLWLNDEPDLMTADEPAFATTFRVASLSGSTAEWAVIEGGVK